LAKSRDVKDVDLVEACTAYETAAVDVAAHNFRTRSARLGDHADLYGLMMRVIGRLADFTMIWEKDASYVFLALLWKELHEPDQSSRERPFAIVRQDNRIGLDLGDKRYRVAITDRKTNETRQDERSFLPLWSDQTGFALPRFKYLRPLLSAADNAWFVSKFLAVAPTGHTRDLEAVSMRKAEKKIARPLNQTDRSRIRADLAHYNVISKKGASLNLTYTVNAVRSLLSYDRKLKNAVPKAIIDILREDGLLLNWDMREDRLVNAHIVPALETHLGFVRRKLDQKQVIFDLPRASVRLVSMAQALFSFQAAGHREYRKVREKGEWERKQRGPLSYPESWIASHGKRIPSEAILSLPALE
jgi:hypothetical protein